MGKIIDFPGHRKYSSEVKQLKEISDRIDGLIVGALSDQAIDPKELAALISHRFGSLLSLVSEKEKLWKICYKIICEQSGLIKK